MTFDVGRFAARIGSLGGISLNSKFRARFFVPGEPSDFLEYTCESFTLPGASINAVPVRVLGYGAPVDAPLTVAYGEAAAQLYVDNNGETVGLFTRWMQSAINYAYEPGGATTGAVDGAYPFQVSYYADYAGRVQVTTFSQSGEEVRNVTLHGVWPRAVGQVQLSWSSRDALAVLPVQFSYRSWTSDDMNG